MPTSYRKLIASIFLTLFLFSTFLFTFSKPARAQAPSPWYNQNPVEWYKKVHFGPDDSEIFGERYTAAQVDWVILSVLTWLPTKFLGPRITSCAADLFLDPDLNVGGCLGIGSSGSLNNTRQNYALKQNGSSNLISSFINAISEDRPLSGITYLKDIGRKFNIVPAARAQGFGFTQALNPAREIWKAFRNVSFGLLVLVILAFSFMIMFRIKISPQVVITVQSALPKLVLTIILVAFSYAIAGFAVDIMYIVIGLVSMVFTGLLHGFPIGTETFLGTFNWLTKGFPASGDYQFGVLWLIVVYLVLFTAGLLFALAIVLGPITVGLASLGVIIGVAAFASTGIGLLVEIAIVLILIIALLWFALRIVWMLLKTYVNILLLTIFAPLQITLGALVPQMGFGLWLRNLASNLAVFIITGLLFMLSFLFLLQGYNLIYQNILKINILDQIINIVFVGTPLILIRALGGVTGSFTGSWPPLLGGGEKATALLMLGVSFVIFTIIPRTADMIKAIIQGQPFAFGTAIGEVLGPVIAPAKWGWGVTTGAATRALGGIIETAAPGLWARQTTGHGAAAPKTAGGPGTQGP